MIHMRMTFLTGVAFAALTIPGAAYAQSTGSLDFDNESVVTGARVGDVGGVEVPEATKAKAVLTQAFKNGRASCGASVWQNGTDRVDAVSSTRKPTRPRARDTQ